MRDTDRAAAAITRRRDGGGFPAGTRLLDRYILRETAKPLIVSLIVVLIALLLERILRLFDLLANHGGPFDLVLRMAANLVPHYLGLALPTAFFISIFVVVSKFGQENELDALQSTGLSVARFTRPFLWIGCGLLVFSILLFGFLQPYSRYAYRAIYHSVITAAWDATVPQAAFIEAADGLTISADTVDATGRQLERVFVHQMRDGEEWVTTAARGVIGTSEDRTRVLLTLEDGTQLRLPPGREPQVFSFSQLTLDRAFQLEAPPYRERGGSERELTLLELWQEMHAPFSMVPRDQLVAEFNARLARALSMPLLPLLAVPMGMAAKRARRGVGITLAALILVVYNHALQFGESLGDVGSVPPVLGVWTPFLLFTIFVGWLFHRVQVRPGENPFGHAFDRMEMALQNAGRLLPRFKRRKPRGRA